MGQEPGAWSLGSTGDLDGPGRVGLDGYMYRVLPRPARPVTPPPLGTPLPRWSPYYTPGMLPRGSNVSWGS